MAEEQKAPAEDGGPEEKKARNPLVFVAIGLFLIGAAVTVGVLAFPGHEEPAATSDVPKATSLLPIPQILVNLASGNSDRVLQATMAIEARGESESAITERFNDDLPKIQDLMIKVLSAYSADEIRGATNKDALQQRLIQELNEHLFEDGRVTVSAVYFTEFVVQ